MKRITIELKPPVAEALDRVTRAEWNEEPSHWTRCAVFINLLLDHDRQLDDDANGEAAAGKAQSAQRDEPGPVRRERDALRKALEAERATRRGDRERYAVQLRNAKFAVARLVESRAAYRDLALRVEAALLDGPPRADFRGIETRLRQTLAATGFRLPAADPPTSPDSGPTPRRNAPARDTS